MGRCVASAGAAHWPSGASNGHQICVGRTARKHRPNAARLIAFDGGVPPGTPERTVEAFTNARRSGDTARLIEGRSPGIVNYITRRDRCSTVASPDNGRTVPERLSALGLHQSQIVTFGKTFASAFNALYDRLPAADDVQYLPVRGRWENGATTGRSTKC